MNCLPFPLPLSHPCFSSFLSRSLTHSLPQYLEQCDRVLFMVDGRVAEDGSYPSLIAAGLGFTQLMASMKVEDMDSSSEEEASTMAYNASS